VKGGGGVSKEATSAQLCLADSAAFAILSGVEGLIISAHLASVPEGIQQWMLVRVMCVWIGQSTHRPWPVQSQYNACLGLLGLLG
jgi:hypothetical protein